MSLHGYIDGEYDDRSNVDNVTLISKFDVSHPLHLHPNDYVALTVVSVKLKGTENYQVWSFILSREALPDVKSAYAIISNEESHRIATGSVSGTSHRRTARGSTLVCENCGFNGHTIDKCFKIIGYPADFRKRKAGLNLKGKNVSNIVVGSNSSNGFSDEQMATLISLIKEKSVNGKGVHSNMTEAFITRIGNMPLTNYLTLYDVLVVPEYCVSLMSVRKVARDSKLALFCEEPGFEKRKNYGDRLGHPADQALDVLKPTLNFDNKNTQLICDTCQRAKQTREPFPLIDHVSTELGELAHLDLWGPYKVTSGDEFNFFLAIVDNFQGLFGDEEKRNSNPIRHDASASENGSFAADEENNSNFKGNGLHDQSQDNVSQDNNGAQNLRSLEKYVNYSYLSKGNYFFATMINKDIEPKTYLEASQHKQWIDAMNAEMDALYRNNTWEIIDHLVKRKAIDSKCGWKIKYKSDGEIERYKARKYCLELIDEFGLIAGKPSNLPMQPNISLTSEPSDTDPLLDNVTKYQKLIGKLIYLTTTRSDIVYTVSCLSQFMHNPLKSHMKTALKVIRYLKGSPGKGINVIKGSASSIDLKAYSDAERARCADTRRSITAYCVFMCGFLVSWKSRYPTVFSLEIHHGGELSKVANRIYDGGKVNWFDQIDSDGFSVVEVNHMLAGLGYVNPKMEYWYKMPDKDALLTLSNDNDVLRFIKYVDRYKLMQLYVVHPVDKPKPLEDNEDTEDAFDPLFCDLDPDFSEPNATELPSEVPNVAQPSEVPNVAEVNEVHNVADQTEIPNEAEHSDGSDESEDNDDSDFDVELEDRIEDVEVDMGNFKKYTDENVEWVGPNEVPVEDTQPVEAEVFEDLDLKDFDSASDPDDIDSNRKKALKMLARKHKHAKVFRAKQMAQDNVIGDYVNRYARLKDYALELQEHNIDTTIKIDVERTSGKRDLLGLDGCFMSGPYLGQILTAVEVDPNNGTYPLAYAVVEAETKDSWTWFLDCLGDDLQLARNSNFTFITDRQKYVCNMTERTCSCKKWDLTGIPCKHAVACIWDMASNSQEPDMWKKSPSPITLTPPDYHTLVGRPTKKRKKSAAELLDGHNSKSCKGQRDPTVNQSQASASASARPSGNQSQTSVTPSAPTVSQSQTFVRPTPPLRPNLLSGKLHLFSCQLHLLLLLD
nr:ribonuclease H-like domain-containing protein [Tanacetum cinerariifolium]